MIIKSIFPNNQSDSLVINRNLEKINKLANKTSANINFRCRFHHKNYFNFMKKDKINIHLLKLFQVLRAKGL